MEFAWHLVANLDPVSDSRIVGLPGGKTPLTLVPRRASMAFSDLFKEPDESYLRRMHMTFYRNWSKVEAEKLFQENFALAKEVVAGRGKYQGCCRVYVVAEKQGSILLAKESSHAGPGAYLARIRADGVTNKDIIWFWDMTNLRRVWLMQHWERHLFESALEKMSSGVAAADAWAMVRHLHPYWGDPVEETDGGFVGEDRRIPPELKDRVDVYLERRWHTGIDNFRAELARSSSFNALVRSEIRAGKI